MGPVSLPSNVALLVAASDLKLVRLLRDAIRTADLSSGKGMPVAAIGPAPNPDRDCYCPAEPTPRYEPRRVYHPTPRYAPREVIRPAPRVAPGPACPPCPPVVPPPAPEELVSRPCGPHSSPIQPPWKVLPWQEPPPPPPKVKIVLHRPDIIHKGSLIDCFI